MANEIPDVLNGEWTNEHYRVAIRGERITVTYRDEVVCDTTFHLDGKELKNLKKRKNWEAYVEGHQYEQFGHFETFTFRDSVLTGIIFVADLGGIELPFAKKAPGVTQEGTLPTFDELLQKAVSSRPPMYRVVR